MAASSARYDRPRKRAGTKRPGRLLCFLSWRRKKGRANTATWRANVLVEELGRFPQYRAGVTPTACRGAGHRLIPRCAQKSAQTYPTGVARALRVRSASPRQPILPRIATTRTIATAVPHPRYASLSSTAVMGAKRASASHQSSESVQLFERSSSRGLERSEFWTGPWRRAAQGMPGRASGQARGNRVAFFASFLGDARKEEPTLQR